MEPGKIQTRSIQGHRLPRRARLSGQKLIRSIITCRNRYQDGLLTIYVAPTPYTYARLGISVSKSCGKAVFRNRLKRLVREAFRLDRNKIPSGLDYMVVLKAKGMAMPTLDEVRASLVGLAERACRQVYDRQGAGG